MAIKFEFYESPNTIGTRKKRYHARVVNWQRINTDYLAREIQYGSSLTVADIKATIISLSEKLAYYLKDGATVVSVCSCDNSPAIHMDVAVKED